VRQTAFDPVTGDTTPRPHRLRIGLYSRTPDGTIARTHSVVLDIAAGDAGRRTEVTELAGLPAPDLLVVNDEDLTYAKVRMDPASEQTVRTSLGDITDPLARALCWTALWHGVRDGETPARDYVRAVAEFGPSESTIGVLLAVLDNARTAIERYADADERAAVREAYLASVAVHLSATEPGSDQQLAWARALAKGSRYSDGELGLVRSLLHGDGAPSGVSADAELRWLLWQALAARGNATPAELDAELIRDTTARGRVGYTLASAARPEEAVKETAWTAMLEEDSLSNELLKATIDGFSLGPAALRTRFEAPYFGSLERVWAQRSNEVASRIVTGLFPSDQDLAPGGIPEEHPTLLRAGAWLAEHPRAPRALRRIVIEQADHLLRALRAQARSQRP
jgi:aminopeptidase N